MLRANGILRNLPSPAPFDRTTHRLHLGDARDLSWVADGSVHLVVTSPPYWTLKEYEHTAEQLGDVEDYEQFLAGVYEGMIIGENARNDDMPVNPCRAKKLSNMRSTGDGKGVILFPPFTMTLGAPSNTSPPTNTWRSRPRASACAKRSSTPTAANAPAPRSARPMIPRSMSRG